MMRRLTLTLAVCLGVASALPAFAQTRHTLEIRDGQVFVDGKPVAAETLPPSLDLTGISAQLSYFGDATPVIELNGALYAFDGETLRVANAETNAPGVTVFFRDNTVPLEQTERGFPGTAWADE